MGRRKGWVLATRGASTLPAQLDPQRRLSPTRSTLGSASRSTTLVTFGVFALRVGPQARDRGIEGPGQLWRR
jgi:hypothetical protein